MQIIFKAESFQTFFAMTVRQVALSNPVVRYPSHMAMRNGRVQSFPIELGQDLSDRRQSGSMCSFQRLSRKSGSKLIRVSIPSQLRIPDLCPYGVDGTVSGDSFNCFSVQPARFRLLRRLWRDAMVGRRCRLILRRVTIVPSGLPRSVAIIAAGTCFGSCYVRISSLVCLLYTSPSPRDS